MREDYETRELHVDDYEKGYLDLVASLSEVGKVTKEMWEAQLQNIANNKFHKIFVIEIDGVLAATITCLVEPKIAHSCGFVGHIEDVVVGKNFRGRGLTRILFDAALSFAEETTCYKAILDCNESLVVLYQKKGFNEVGRCMRINFK